MIWILKIILFLSQFDIDKRKGPNNGASYYLLDDDKSLNKDGLEYSDLLIDKGGKMLMPIIVKPDSDKIEIDVKHSSNLIIAKNYEKFCLINKQKPEVKRCTCTVWILSLATCSCLFLQYSKYSPAKRYTENKYNLNLSYIMHNIIWMSFPGNTSRSYWRNSKNQVLKLFKSIHNEKVKIYNWCAENNLMVDGKYRK